MIIKENKNKRVIIIVVICFIAIVAVLFGIWKLEGTWIPLAGKQDQKESAKPSLESYKFSNYEKRSKAVITTEEMEKIKGKSEQEVKDFFNSEKDACKAKYSGLSKADPASIMQQIPNLFRIDPFETEKFVTCSSIKDNKIEYCHNIPDPVIGGHCTYRYMYFVNSIFPAMHKGECSPEYVQACKDSGKGDCENLCKALVTAKTEKDCANFQKGTLSHSICEAVAKRDKSACDEQANKFVPSPQDPSVGEDQWLECVQTALFVRAVRENNQDLLEEIVRRDQYPIDKLYFDNNFNCQSVLDIGEMKCDLYYDDMRLNLLLNASKV